MLCVQESVCDNVVDRLKLRLAGLKCVSLQSEADRSLVDTAVQEAQQQGATVSQEPLDTSKVRPKHWLCPDSHPNP